MKDKNLNKNGTKETGKELSSCPLGSKYSGLDRRAAREIYYQLGENRTLETIFKILGIGVSTLKAWSSEDKWNDWAEARQKEDKKLALQGKYSTQILGLNAKAKATLEEIVEKFSERLNSGMADIRASDAVNASKLLLGLAEADKTPDILNTAIPIVIVVERKELEKELVKELAKETAKELTKPEMYTDIPIVIDSLTVEKEKDV